MSPTRWGTSGIVLAFTGIITILVGVVLCLSGLKGVALTEEWSVHVCRVERVIYREVLLQNPLVMPRGAQLRLKTAVHLSWNDKDNIKHIGIWNAINGVVNYDTMSGEKTWDTLIANSRKNIIVTLTSGQTYPNTSTLINWYRQSKINEKPYEVELLPSQVEVVKITTASYFGGSDIVTIYPSSKTPIMCFAPTQCTEGCMLMVSDPEIVRSKAERILITGFIFTFTVICCFAIVQKATRDSLCHFQSSATSFCTAVVSFAENPEERTPLVSRQHA